MDLPHQIGQFLVSGLALGSLYALLALGFVAIYRVSGVMNLAHGEFAMLGAMIAVSLHDQLGVPLAALVAVTIVTGVGLALQWLTSLLGEDAPPIPAIIVTLGVAAAIRGTAQLIWRTDFYPLPAFSPGPPIKVLGIIILRQYLWIWAATALLLGALYWLLQHTYLGMAMRACVANRQAARLMGISPTHMARLAFGLSAGLGAIAGIVTTPVTYASYDTGATLVFKGLVATIVGGVGSPIGAVVGGLTLGMVEALGAGLISSAFKDVIAFVIMFMVLFFRPGGIFAERAFTPGVGSRVSPQEIIGTASRNRLGLGVLVAVVAALPLFVRSPYYLSIVIFIGFYTILTVGLSLLTGYAGQISLGHAGFYAIGAYSSALLTTKLGLSPWLSLVGAVVITGVSAFLIGKPIFRLKGLHLAFATLCFGATVFLVFKQTSDLTGGISGVLGIPALAVGGFVFDTDIKNYYLVWTVAIAFLALAFNLVDSRVGRALRSLHSDPLAAEALGVNTSRYKLQILVVSAAFAGLAGGLYAHYLRFVSPLPFSTMFSIVLISHLVLGGLGSLWGAVIGAALITLLTEVVRTFVPKVLGHGYSEVESIMVGLILVGVMLFMPQGLIGMGSVLSRLRNVPIVDKLLAKRV
jgi:branched-chain amino acid transport system permease protein